MKKFLLILFVICIFGSVVWVAGFIQPDSSSQPPALHETTSPKEEEGPGKKIKDLTLTYYSDDQRYRLQTTLRTADQDAEGNITFEGMKAVLHEKNWVLQEFITPSGALHTASGIVQLQGPVVLTTGNYQLSLNQIEMDLNQGSFQAKGAVSLAHRNYLLEAKEMSADFDFRTIHFKGRPRLTITKGG